MTVQEWERRAKEAGLLSEGIRIGVINPTRIRYAEIKRYFLVLRSQGLTYNEAIAQTSIDCRVSDGYARKIITGNI